MPDVVQALLERIRATNPSARARDNWQGRLRDLLKGSCASALVVSVVGCDGPTFRSFISGQWQPGQCWENYGKGPGTWQVDHKMPCSAWPDLTCDHQLRQAFHYSNLQPLWTWENKKKGSRPPREIGDGDILHPPARTPRDSHVDFPGAGEPFISAQRVGPALAQDGIRGRRTTRRARAAGLGTG